MEAANCLRLALELDDRQDLRGEYDLIVLKVREQMARSLRRSSPPPANDGWKETG